MKKRSACTMDCGDACSLIVDTERRRIRGNPEHPFTKGFICRKGAKFFANLDAKDRIVTPLLRKGAAFEAVSWDRAMDIVARRLGPLRDRPERVLHLHGYGYRGVLAQASENFFTALGASAYYGSLCDDTGIAACKHDFGALQQNDPQDLLHADRIVNWGRDFCRSSIHTAALIQSARKSGARVLTITPGGGNTRFSDEVITLRPGSDRFLAAAAIGLFREVGIPGRILERTSNWPALRDLLARFSIEELCAACQVPVKKAALVFKWYSAKGAVATLIGWGLQRYTFGGQNVRFINALAMVSGHIGRRGGGAYFSISSSRNFARWPVSAGGRCPPPGPRRKFLLPLLGPELKRADPPVEFIWIDGHNVVNQVPDSRAAAEALRQPFVVVVDGFMNDTARCADLILPPAMGMEREDAIGSCLHDYVVHCAKVVEPRGQCRSDFDILRELGSRLDPAINFPAPDTCLRRGLARSGIDLDRLRAVGYARTDRPPVAFENLAFAHPDGRYRFPEALSAEPDRDPQYPLQLLTLVRERYMHSQIPAAAQQGLPQVWVSEENPLLAALAPGRNVYLVTPLGAMQVLLTAAAGLHPGVALMRRGGWMMFGHNPNALIRPAVTDMGQGTAYYSQACRLEIRQRN